VSVPEAASLREGYDLRQDSPGFWTFRVNVSAERIPEAFRRLVARIPGPGSFALEIPTDSGTEAQLRTQPTDPFHCDVWYLDWLRPSDMLALFAEYEPLLLHDGFLRFGFGGQKAYDEVFVSAYKLFMLYATKPEPVAAALADLGFPRVPDLRTAATTFTPERPGVRLALTDLRPSLDDMLSSLRARGLYFAEHRADY